MNEDIGILFLGNVCPTKSRANPNQGRVYSPDGIAPCLNTVGGGNLEPMIFIESTQKTDFIDSSNYYCTLTETMEKGSSQVTIMDDTYKIIKVGNIYPSGGQNGNVYDTEGISPTLLSGETNTKGNGGIGSNNAPKILKFSALDDTYRIRKLTPKECFRLMGFDDADVDLLIENGISNTQLYKMAGNSIVVNMLEFLFCQIFDNDNEIWV